MVAAIAVSLAVAARSGLGWFLDDECALAGTNCPLARARLFRPGIKPARCSLLRPNGFVLDRSPFVQHVAGLLHGGLPTAVANAANSLCCSADHRHDCLFRGLS